MQLFLSGRNDYLLHKTAGIKNVCVGGGRFSFPDTMTDMYNMTHGGGRHMVGEEIEGYQLLFIYLFVYLF